MSETPGFSDHAELSLRQTALKISERFDGALGKRGGGGGVPYYYVCMFFSCPFRMWLENVNLMK